MTTYRKRGTEVDAFRWTGHLYVGQTPEWFPPLLSLGRARVSQASPEAPYVLYLDFDLPSGKGTPLVANVGDWIVRNVRGGVFPMTSEKFAETYEAVDVESRNPAVIARRLATLAFGADRVDTVSFEVARAALDDVPCSFCGKPPREVKHLVAAATGARICDECLTGAREVEPKETRTMADRVVARLVDEWGLWGDFFARDVRAAFEAEGVVVSVATEDQSS